MSSVYEEKYIFGFGNLICLYKFVENILAFEYNLDIKKDSQKMPVIYLNNAPVVLSDLNKYEYDSTLSIKLFKPENNITTALYGTHAANGVILINMP